MGTAELGNFKFKNRTTSELSYRNLSSNRPSVIVDMLHRSTYFSTFYILKESCLDTKVNWTPPFSAFTFNTRRPLHLHSQAGKPQSGLLAPYGQLKSSISAASVITCDHLKNRLATSFGPYRALLGACTGALRRHARFLTNQELWGPKPGAMEWSACQWSRQEAAGLEGTTWPGRADPQAPMRLAPDSTPGLSQLFQALDYP